MNVTIAYNTTRQYLKPNLNYFPTSYEDFLRQKYRSNDKRTNPNLIWLPRWDIGCISAGFMRYFPKRRNINFDVESIRYNTGLFKLGALHLIFIPLCMILFYLGSCRKFCITPRMHRLRMLMTETRLCSCILGTALCLVFVLHIHLHIATQDNLTNSVKINVATLSSVRVFLSRTKRVLDDIKLHLHWTTNSYAYYREKQDIESRYYKHIKPISRSGDELTDKPIGNYSLVTPLMKALANMELWMYLFYTILWGSGLLCVYIFGTLQLTKLSTIFGMICCSVGATTLMMMAVAIVDLNRNPAPAVHLLTIITTMDHSVEKQGLLNEYTRVCQEWYKQFSERRDEYNRTFLLAEGELIKDFKKRAYYYTKTRKRQIELTNKFIVIRTTQVPRLYDVRLDCKPPPFEYKPPPVLRHITFENIPDWRTVGIGAICADDKLLQILITQILILDLAAALCILILFFGVLMIRSNNCNFLGWSYGYCPASIDGNTTCWIVRRKTFKEHFKISQPIPVIDCEDCLCDPKSKKKKRKAKKFRKKKQFSKTNNLKESKSSLEEIKTEKTKLRKSKQKNKYKKIQKTYEKSKKKPKKDKKNDEELESSSESIDITQTIDLKKAHGKNKKGQEKDKKLKKQSKKFKTSKSKLTKKKTRNEKDKEREKKEEESEISLDRVNKQTTKLKQSTRKKKQEKTKLKQQTKNSKKKEKKLKKEKIKDKRNLEKLKQSNVKKTIKKDKSQLKKQSKTSKKSKQKFENRKKKYKKQKSYTSYEHIEDAESSLKNIETQTLPSTSKTSLTEEETILGEHLVRLSCDGSEICPGSKKLNRSKLQKGSNSLKPLCKPCSTQFPRTPPGSLSCPGLNICPGTNSVSIRLPCKGSEVCPGSKESKCVNKVNGSKSLKPLCKPCSAQYPRTPPESLSCPGLAICPGTNSISIRLSCKGSEICPGSKEPKCLNNINGSKSLKPVCKPCSTQLPRTPPGRRSCPGSKTCPGSNSISVPSKDFKICSKLKESKRSKNPKRSKKSKGSKSLKRLCKPTQFLRTPSENLSCPGSKTSLRSNSVKLAYKGSKMYPESMELQAKELQKSMKIRLPCKGIEVCQGSKEFQASKEPTTSKMAQISKETKKSKKNKKLKEPKKTKEPINSKQAKTSQVLKKSKELSLTCKSSEVCQVSEELQKSKEPRLTCKGFEVCLDSEKLQISKELQILHKTSKEHAFELKSECSEVCLGTKELEISKESQLSKEVNRSKVTQISKEPILPCKCSEICLGIKDLQISNEPRLSSKCSEDCLGIKESQISRALPISKEAEKTKNIKKSKKVKRSKKLQILKEPRLPCKGSEVCPSSKGLQSSKKARKPKKSCQKIETKEAKKDKDKSKCLLFKSKSGKICESNLLEDESVIDEHIERLSCRAYKTCPGSRDLQISKGVIESSKKARRSNKSSRKGEKIGAKNGKVKSRCSICKNKSERSCELKITEEEYVVHEHIERLSCRASEICPGSKLFQISQKAKNGKRCKEIKKSKKAKRSEMIKRSKELKRSKNAKGSKTIKHSCKPCTTQCPRTPPGRQICLGPKLCPGSKAVRKSRRLEERKTVCEKALCGLKTKI